jgi:hypothetical protein
MLENQEDMTYVRIPKTLRAALKGIGNKGESYADIIRMLYETYLSKGGGKKR